MSLRTGRFDHSRLGRLGLAVALALTVSACISAQARAAATDAAPGEVSTRIVGGDPAPLGAWPSIAFLYLYPPGTDDVYLCGGSLVDRRWLITAAHCVLDSQGRVTTRMDIGIGATNRTTAGFNGEYREAEQVVAYPGYDADTFFRPPKGDLALIALSRASTKPIIRIGAPTDWSPGSQAQVAGWGLTDPSNPSSTPTLLRQASLTITSNSACEADYPNVDLQAALCATGAGETPPRDSCNGDSGGPLEVEPSPGTRRLVGLVSYGRVDCGAASGLYTRLDTYRGWIGSYVVDSLDAPTKVSFGKRKSRGKRRRQVTKTIRFTNRSESLLPAAPADYALSGKGRKSFTRVTSQCRTELAHGAACSVKVTFRPTSKGTKSASLRISSSRGSTMAEVPLTGKGI